MDELIDITVTLKTSAVRLAVARAWEEIMEPPQGYSNKVPEGYAAIKEQVARHCLRIDATEMIQKLAKEKLQTIVAEVVDKVLRDAIVKQAKLLRDSGRLFEADHG